MSRSKCLRNVTQVSDLLAINEKFNKIPPMMERLYGRPLKNNPRIFLPDSPCERLEDKVSKHLSNTRQTPVYSPFGNSIFIPRYLDNSDITADVFHELIHAEDYFLMVYEQKKFTKVVLEARALYATAIFCEENNIPNNDMLLPNLREGPRRTGYRASSILSRVAGLSALSFQLFAISRVVGDVVKGASMFEAVLGIALTSLMTLCIAKIASWRRKNAFFKKAISDFTNTMYQMGKTIGDPIKAFQITTDKCPLEVDAFQMGIKFYEDEIRKSL